MDSTDFPLTAPGRSEGERDTLIQFLDYYRQVLLRKAAGLSNTELAQTLGPSDVTIGGLLKHMSVVETNWFVRRFEGGEYPEPWASAPWGEDADWDFHSAADDSLEYLVELFSETVERSRATVVATESLDQVSVRTRDGVPWSMRWILVHLIEEYARHVGHADVIRESIDGATGD
jgi:uncharacterized damage-inducible protein DinB